MIFILAVPWEQATFGRGHIEAKCLDRGYFRNSPCRDSVGLPLAFATGLE
jgi:hypothetical protein